MDVYNCGTCGNFKDGVCIMDDTHRSQLEWCHSWVTPWQIIDNDETTKVLEVTEDA